MASFDETRARTDVPVVVADQDGIIREVNARFCGVFGWAPDEIVGKPLTAIIPPDLRDAHHLGFSRFLVTQEPTLLGRPLNLRAVRRDGTVFDAEHVIVGERRGGAWVFAATVRPLP